MPYFPPTQEPTRYYCPNCKKWYQPKEGPMISCCVLHPPGDCCHVGEGEVTGPRELLQENFCNCGQANGNCGCGHGF